jgi:orotate phosphoribosyltransferase
LLLGTARDIMRPGAGARDPGMVSPSAYPGRPCRPAAGARHGRRMEGFWVREEVKSHGTQKRVEGGLPEGARVAVIDYVFTKGGSALKAVEAVRELECEVVLVLALVDRLTGAEDLFQQKGIKNYRAVFTIRDFGVGTDARGEAETAPG